MAGFSTQVCGYSALPQPPLVINTSDAAGKEALVSPGVMLFLSQLRGKAGSGVAL